MYNRVRTTERRDEGGSKLSGSKNLVASRGINRFFRVGMVVVVAIRGFQGNGNKHTMASGAEQAGDEKWR